MSYEPTPLALACCAGVDMLDVPIYGSTEWFALPRKDRRRLASMARAAEAWRRDGDALVVAAALQADFDRIDRRVHETIRGASDDVHRAMFPERHK